MVGRLERSLRAWGTVIIEITGIIVFFVLWFSIRDSYAALFGAIIITSIIYALVTHHVRSKTGRWWFIPTQHFPLDPPDYDTSLADFFHAVETQFENRGEPA